ncbi:nitroreductase family deazaflavin-dependent oxidoreductase [Actinomadura sp. NEAU-AAG7]|uniref:nitroreductase family deazaflavin-dependent oxidoreductase n=1 Tax=Actinomadura sp. NEAU-AAG7 TaxID=2839640 RepID=UPI001BE49878|nr:nitroreductase family deazaflavin-dependent oxidoreductase [Actinomadura sp. NEAU-AAG7]MBT2210771.1 nitroreductase family deazaflavin-dependent oxidoreductase [Actinomadura sp. NEAU-AAG7]
MLYGPEHVRRYEETDGEVGHDWENGAPVLILTTRGRKSGVERKSPLIYQEHDGAYVLVASDGGAPVNPNWYQNLQAEPEVKVQVRGDRFTARARDASAAERAAVWSKMVAVWPNYEKYRKTVDREIPVVFLERI